MNDNSADADVVTPLTRWERVVKWWAIGLVTLILLIVVTLGAFTLVMARMPEYRAQMQSWVSARAKLDIEFADRKSTRLNSSHSS